MKHLEIGPLLVHIVCHEKGVRSPDVFACADPQGTFKLGDS